MFLVAARNIRKGEEITDNYSIHFSDMVADQRRPWMEASDETKGIYVEELKFENFKVCFASDLSESKFLIGQRFNWL